MSRQRNGGGDSRERAQPVQWFGGWQGGNEQALPVAEVESIVGQDLLVKPRTSDPWVTHGPCCALQTQPRTPSWSWMDSKWQCPKANPCPAQNSAAPVSPRASISSTRRASATCATCRKFASELSACTPTAQPGPC